MHGGDGDVPVEEPELVGTAHEGVDLAGDAPDRQAGRPRPPSSMAAKRSPGGATMHSAAPGWSAATDSTVTMESMPPPKGISGRPGSGS